MSEEVPQWPGVAGWGSLLSGLLWLTDPTTSQVPLLAITAALAACWLYGVLRHVIAYTNGATWEVSSERPTESPLRPWGADPDE